MARAARGGRARRAATIALLAGLTLVLAWPSFRDEILDRDEGVYALVAEGWAAGALPYRDRFDHKPPGVYLLYLLAHAVGGDSQVPVRMLFACLVVLTGLAAGAVVRRCLDDENPWPSVLAAVLVIFYMSSSATWGGTANTEIPMVCLLTLAALAALRARDGQRWRWGVLCGLCLSLALLFKPTGAGEALLIALAYLAPTLAGGRRAAGWARDALALLVGVLTPVAAFALYFQLHGALADAIAAIVTFNRLYLATAPIPLAARAGQMLGRLAGAFLPLSCGFSLLVLAQLGRRLDWRRGFVLAWCAASLAGIFVQGRDYAHYYQELVVPFSCAVALLVARIERARADGRRAVALTRAGSVACLALLALPEMSSTARRWSWIASHQSWQREAAREAAAIARPGEPILVYGAEAQIYLHARRTPASRYIYKGPLLGNSALSRKAREVFMADLVRNRPRVVIVVRNDGDPALGAPASSDEWRTYWEPRLAAIVGGYQTLVRPDYLLLAEPAALPDRRGLHPGE
jgi:4-amino-4-deoxy-L-arabinose transferase-like glycosyltransferase